MLVSRLKGARQRKRSTGIKVDGRKNYAELVPKTVDRAKALKAEGLTLRQVAERLAAEGFHTSAETPYQFTAVGRMISGRISVTLRAKTGVSEIARRLKIGRASIYRR